MERLANLWLEVASAAGLDQLQHLRTETSGAALTIEGPQNQAGGRFNVTLHRCGFSSGLMNGSLANQDLLLITANGR